MTDFDYRSVIAVVLGGGKGERLFPLTEMRAKPAVPVAGKYRIIDIPISNCIRSGLSKIFVLTQFNSASLNRHVNSAYRFDGFSEGFVEILAAEQSPDNMDWFQGTADAVRQNLRHFHHYNPKLIIVLSGDQLYTMNFRHLIARHLELNADLTVATLPCTREAAKGFGIMKINEAGMIHTFQEKPQRDEDLDQLKCSAADLAKLGFQQEDNRHYLASMGIYIFNADYLLQHALNEKDQTDFGKHVIPNAIRSKRVGAFLYNGYWEDIGTIKSYFKANLDMVEKYPEFDFYLPSSKLYTNPRHLAPSKFYDCSLQNSLVAEGAILERVTVKRSLIGVRSIIAPGTWMENVVMMGADWYNKDAPQDKPISLGVGENCNLKNCILDKNVRLGKKVHIINKNNLQNHDDKDYCIRDGIIIVKKGRMIPDGTVI